MDKTRCNKGFFTAAGPGGLFARRLEWEPESASFDDGSLVCSLDDGLKAKAALRCLLAMLGCSTSRQSRTSWTVEIEKVRVCPRRLIGGSFSTLHPANGGFATEVPQALNGHGLGALWPNHQIKWVIKGRICIRFPGWTRLLRRAKAKSLTATNRSNGAHDRDSHAPCFGSKREGRHRWWS